jgi:hypothetical protein
VAAGARTDVQDAPAHVSERRTLRLCPIVVVGEEPPGSQRRPDLAVVALELRLTGDAALEVVEEQAPEGVLPGSEDPGYAASEVRSPSSPAIGRIAAMTLRMWSSSSRPRPSAPA